MIQASVIKIFPDTQQGYKEQVKALYIDTFTQGPSAQWVDAGALEEELRLTYQKGVMLVAVQADELVGALFVYPLSDDYLLPESISRDLNLTKIPYIAELMVAASCRGCGLGSRLMSEAMELLRTENYQQVYIRVWDQNRAALKLYEKLGFRSAGVADQVKYSYPDKRPMMMRKIYLFKALQ